MITIRKYGYGHSGSFSGLRSGKATWSSSATTTAWTLGSNWVEGVAPAANDDVIVTADGTFDPTANSAINVNSLTLIGSTTLNLGAALSVGAGGVLNNMASNSLFVAPGTVLTAAQTWGGTRSIFTGGGITGEKMSVNGSTVRFDGANPAWSAGLDVRSTASMGSGFTAGTTITPWGTGTITLINQNSATLAASSPTLGLASSTGNNSFANAMTLANPIDLSSPSTGAYTINQTGDTSGSAPHYYILTGNITGGGSRTLSFTNGAPTASTNLAVFILTGSNTYTASTTVSTNTILQVGSGGVGSITSSAITVSGGTLQGNGSCGSTVTVANVANSTIRGGTGSGNAGTLSTGALTFSGASARLAVGIGSTTTCSLVASSGAVALGGMTVNFDASALNAGTYTLITGASMSGSVVQGTLPTGRTWTSLGIVGNNLVAVLA